MGGYKFVEFVLFLISSSGLLKKEKNNFFFTFLNREKQTWYWEKCGYFGLGMGPKFVPRDGQKIPCRKDTK